ncbi:MAG: FmdB family zinc ribbon protein [Christensenellales bacterium]|jgi:putative FmdB family regulatory protein
MPMYEFKCRNCGKNFEELVSVSGRDAVRCPDCGGEVQRVYEGACAFGAKKGGSSCTGNCEHCAGCHQS